MNITKHFEGVIMYELKLNQDELKRLIELLRDLENELDDRELLFLKDLKRGLNE